MKPVSEYTTSEKMKSYIKGKEKLELVAYPDPKTKGPPWTIGYGATGLDVHPGMRWTLPQAEARFEDDIFFVEGQVKKAVAVPVTQGQFDALVSIFFNVGPGSRWKDGIARLKDGRESTLMRKLNQGDYAGAGAEFAKWISPGSNVERGLKIRRMEEFTGFWDAV